AALAGRNVGRPRPMPAVVARPAVVPAPAALDFALVGKVGSFRVDARAHTARSLAILGPTGAGKTLTVRMLAGLVRPISGAIHLDDVDVTAQETQQRRVGYVPQDSSLLPRLPVWRQVGFGVDTHPDVAAYWMQQLNLTELADRTPDQLSGGQRRKVALARALARAPRLLVLDEPFTGLDTPVRDELRRDLRRLQREVAPTLVVVTHDPHDAAMLADDVLVLADGETLQTGRLQEVYAAPRTRDVARLLGIINVFELAVIAPGRVGDGEGVSFLADTHELADGHPVVVIVDPAGIVVRNGATLTATVVDVIDVGPAAEVALRLAPEMILRCPRSNHPTLRVGDETPIDIDMAAVRVVPRQP